MPDDQLEADLARAESLVLEACELVGSMTVVTMAVDQADGVELETLQVLYARAFTRFLRRRHGNGDGV